MYRSMFQVYVKGSDKALEFYRKVFDAELLCSYPNDDGTLMHSELNVCGQVLAISEADTENVITGSVMQFCLHFGEGKDSVVRKIYDEIKEGAEILYPLDKCGFSPLMTDLIDKFGIRWCIFV